MSHVRYPLRKLPPGCMWANFPALDASIDMARESRDRLVPAAGLQIALAARWNTLVHVSTFAGWISCGATGAIDDAACRRIAEHIAAIIAARGRMKEEE